MRGELYKYKFGKYHFVVEFDNGWEPFGDVHVFVNDKFLRTFYFDEDAPAHIRNFCRKYAMDKAYRKACDDRTVKWALVSDFYVANLFQIDEKYEGKENFTSYTVGDREAKRRHEQLYAEYEIECRALYDFLKREVEAITKTPEYHAFLEREKQVAEADRYQIDPEIRDLVALLNEIDGVETEFSCQGNRQFIQWKRYQIVFPGKHQRLAYVAFKSIPLGFVAYLEASPLGEIAEINQYRVSSKAIEHNEQFIITFLKVARRLKEEPVLLEEYAQIELEEAEDEDIQPDEISDEEEEYFVSLDELQKKSIKVPILTEDPSEPDEYSIEVSCSLCAYHDYEWDEDEEYDGTYRYSHNFNEICTHPQHEGMSCSDFSWAVNVINENYSTNYPSICEHFDFDEFTEVSENPEEEAEFYIIGYYEVDTPSPEDLIRAHKAYLRQREKLMKEINAEIRKAVEGIKVFRDGQDSYDVRVIHRPIINKVVDRLVPLLERYSAEDINRGYIPLMLSNAEVSEVSRRLRERGAENSSPTKNI